MKQLKIFIFASLVIGGILIFAQDTNAQSEITTGYAISSFELYGERLDGYSATTLNGYNFGFYYDARVSGSLYAQNGNRLSYGMRDGNPSAEVFTGVDNVVRGQQYRLVSDHYVLVYFFEHNDAQEVVYRDEYGVSALNGGGEQPSPYEIRAGPSLEIRHRTIQVATTRVTLQIPLAAVPQLTSIDATGGFTDTNIATSLRGSNLFGNNQSIQVSGTGVTATIRAGQIPNSIEILDIEIQIASDAELGDHNLTLTVAGQTSNSVVFRVGDRSPVISSISPSEAAAGESVAVTITGTNFGVNPNINIDGGGISQITTNAGGTQIQAVFTVADSASEGSRDVAVVSRGASGTGFIQGTGNSATSNSVGFEVSAKIKYEISDVISIMVGESKSVHVKITGSKGKATSLSLGTTGSNTPKARFANGATSINITGDIDTNYTIIGVAGSSQSNDTYISLLQNPFGPGSNAGLLKRFTVIGVIFEQESACSGFDNVETPNPYLMVPQNGTNKFKATVVPSGASGNFRLAGLEQNGVSASPATITNGQQTITVTAGNNVGTFTLQALATNATEPAAVLKIAVKKRINKTVAIHAVTEDNDDVQAIAVGQGEPNQIAIQAAGKTLATQTTGGDDQRTTVPGPSGRNITVINTGNNGIRETVVAGTDIEIIPMNQGKPNSVCVTSNTNQFLDTKKDTNNDDEVMTDSTTGLEYLSTGANGLCQTTANNTDIVPLASSIPTATDLQAYLNNITWGRQANVFFTVTKGQDFSENFDLDRDGLLSAIRGNEIEKIGNSPGVDNASDYRLFYTGTNILAENGVTPGAFTYFQTGESFFSPRYNGSRNYQTAHEAGHLLQKIKVESSLREDLMFEEDLSTSPCRIRKRDWDLIDTANP